MGTRVQAAAVALTLWACGAPPVDEPAENTGVVEDPASGDSGSGGDTGPADEGQPDICLDRAELDFTSFHGTVLPGDDAVCFVEICNEGTAPLVINDFVVSNSELFDVISVLRQQEVAPSSRLPVVVEYTPVSVNGDTEVLSIHSNDPDEPVVELVLRGNGG